MSEIESKEQSATGQETPNAGDGTDNANGAQDSSSAGGEKNSQQQGDASTTEGEKPEGGEGDKGQQAEGDSPAYEYKVPEGYTPDDELKSEFEAYAKEKGFTQEDVDKHMEFAERMISKQYEDHQSQVEEWAKQVRADKELGGDKLKETLEVARRAIDKYGSPELKSLLDTTGLGNHPEVVKFVHAIGKEISEDGFVQGSLKRANDAAQSAAKKLFPNMN